MFLFGGSVAQPTASFTSSCTLLVCSFDATASTPASGLTYAWTFGDGGVASGATPQHTYLAAGPRTVTLTVTDTLNQTASVNHLANPNLGPPPTAAFTPTCTLLSCSFNASASTGPSGGITSYAWDFGDGSTGTGVTTSHSYAAGTFTVSLTVTDGVGQTSTVTHQVSPASNAVAFVTSVKSNAKAATQTLTVPTSVASGNGMLLVATTASAAVPTAPGGWTLVGTSTATGSVLTTAVYQKVATIADPGSSVAVGFGSSVVGSVQLLVYSGTSATNPVASFVTASNRTSQTTEVTPTTSIGSPAWVVSLWQVKTSLPTTGTNFTTPVGQTVRSATTFTGGGHTAALATDGGAPAAAGTVGGLSTTLDGAAGAATTWTIVLAAA
jgi:PKD repeat protein